MNATYSLLGATALCLSLVCAPASASDAAAGAEKAGQLCAACHGPDGKTPIDPSYPILAGQLEDYLVVALKAYRSGERNNAIMSATAKTLSTADIENLAAHFAGLPGPLSVRR